MEITEVRIKLMEEPGERLKAFCSITFDDCFVVRDLKIIDGTNGPFVAMPSRKLTSHCQKCGMKNHLRAGLLQPVWRQADRRPRAQGRRRPGEALCRHRPSDQFRLPRDDPGTRDPRVSTAKSSAQNSRATSRATTTSISNIRKCRVENPPASIRPTRHPAPASSRHQPQHGATRCEGRRTSVASAQ